MRQILCGALPGDLDGRILSTLVLFQISAGHNQYRVHVDIPAVDPILLIGKPQRENNILRIQLLLGPGVPKHLHKCHQLLFSGVVFTNSRQDLALS